MMRRAVRSALALVLALAALAAPSLAADKTTDIFGSIALQKGDAVGQSRSASGELNFGVTKLLDLGVLFTYSYFKPPSDAAVTETLDSWAMGGQVVLHTTPAHNGIVMGVGVTVPQGDADGTLVTPWLGLEFGQKTVVFRVAYSHPFNYGFDGGDAVDLERDVIAAAIGFRFK